MNIWSTLEAEAWCRGFDYENYHALCVRMSLTALGEKAYNILCEAFQTQLEEDMEDSGLDSFDEIDWEGL